MNATELKAKVIDAMKEQGFVDFSEMFLGTTFRKNGERNYIIIKEVGRHNGTAENKSVEIIILRIISECLRTIEGKEKISCNMGEKAIASRIARAVEKYDSIR